MVEDIHKGRFIIECTLTLSSDSKLHVHGSVMVYYCDDKVNINKVIKEKNNPCELILDLHIVKGSIPVEAMPRPFIYTEQGEHVNNYKQVTVRYKDETCTINVK